jgi:hypothetical protein
MMKYICFGYYDEKTWETMSESERNAMIDECFAYDDVLRKNGNFVGGEALQSARNATTLRWKNGEVFNNKRRINMKNRGLERRQGVFSRVAPWQNSMRRPRQSPRPTWATWRSCRAKDLDRIRD